MEEVFLIGFLHVDFHPAVGFSFGVEKLALVVQGYEWIEHRGASLCALARVVYNGDLRHGALKKTGQFIQLFDHITAQSDLPTLVAAVAGDVLHDEDAVL